jgi:hypothetical protein
MKSKEEIMMRHCSDNGLLNMNLGRSILAAMEEYALQSIFNVFSPDGKAWIVHENGQPHGIRDKGGYLLFFPKIQKYTDQEERYIKELQECFALADKIIKAL